MYKTRIENWLSIGFELEFPWLGTYSVSHNYYTITQHCSGCRENMLFSNGFLLILNFQSFSKFSPSPLHQISHWNIKNMTEKLHSIKNCIKWKHEPNYDRELSKCNFLQSQTSTPVERFCKSGWHKLYQQHMSALNTNRNIQTV